MSKKIIVALAMVLVLAMASMSTLACTAIYVGADLTADGSFMFARSEDYSSSYNKMFEVAEAGVHKAGDVYEGCYGFTFTFTHDSYSYTAFRDDNGAGVNYVCPDCDHDCGEFHVHTPYQAAGTNSMGVSMSATETLGGTKEIRAIDPCEDLGIEEAEIPTVILSEAATAREGVELLLKIYDEAGANAGSGIFIADANECWYIENVTGHQYIAVKCPSTMAFAEPNMSVIGLIDLDDTENVIASSKLIETAKAAGTYVGDEEANTINYALSYTSASIGARMVEALPYLTGNTYEEVVYDDYMISNVDAEGNIVTLYTNIVLDHAFTPADIVGYYHLSTIGKGGNTETHIFQISDATVTGTVEWVACNDASKNVFVPYLPMLTTDTAACYQVSTAKAVKTQEQPEAGAYYASNITVYTAEGRQSVPGFVVLPENWADSWYWTVDVFSHVADDEQKAALAVKLDELQADCYAAVEGLMAAAASENPAEACTAYSMDLANKTHDAMVELAQEIVK